MIRSLLTNYEEIVNSIRKETKNYFTTHPLKCAVLGVSGGIDSALDAALLRPVFKELGIPLIGRSITIESNKLEEIDRARKVGLAFCDDFDEIDLTKQYIAYKNSAIETPIRLESETEKQYKIRMGNVKARMRMIYLYDLAQLHRGLVLSTDNLTEYYMGFWTLQGDVGDFSPIQNLWKTEVYGISKWLIENELKTFDEKEALQVCIDAVPTDGLGVSNSDLDQLGASSYEEVDKIMIEHLNTGSHEEHPVVKRYKSSDFKRNHPYIVQRECYNGPEVWNSMVDALIRLEGE
jgi:NAD+ synthetase